MIWWLYFGPKMSDGCAMLAPQRHDVSILGLQPEHSHNRVVEPGQSINVPADALEEFWDRALVAGSLYKERCRVRKSPRYV